MSDSAWSFNSGSSTPQPVELAPQVNIENSSFALPSFHNSLQPYPLLYPTREPAEGDHSDAMIDDILPLDASSQGSLDYSLLNGTSEVPTDLDINGSELPLLEPGRCLGVVIIDVNKVDSGVILHPLDPVNLVRDRGILRVEDPFFHVIGHISPSSTPYLLPLMDSGKVELQACIPDNFHPDRLQVRVLLFHIPSSGPIDILQSVEKEAWVQFATQAGVTLEYIEQASQDYASLGPLLPPVDLTEPSVIDPNNLLPIPTAAPVIPMKVDDDVQEITLIDLTKEPTTGFTWSSTQGLPYAACSTDVHLKQLFENLHSTAALEEMEPHPMLGVELRPYQKQALAWLVARERGSDAQKQEPIVEEPIVEPPPLPRGLPPPWKEYTTAAGKKYYHNPETQVTSWDCPIPDPPPVVRPPKPKKHKQDNPPPIVRGGLLCDEMGLGKTVEMLALIVTCRPPPSGPKSTLIVTPLSVLQQWHDEIRLHTGDGNLSVYIYHGPTRNRDPAFLAKHDVVLTTFTTLAAELPDKDAEDSDEIKERDPKKRKRSASGPGTLLAPNMAALHTVKWLRVILDEAHTIKDRTTRAARAAFALQAERRWAVTGTPIQNKLDDLFALLHFLQVNPYGKYDWWAHAIVRPIRNRDERGLTRLRAILEAILLRRLKMQRINDAPIVSLPPRTVLIRSDTFSPEEHEFYQGLWASSKIKFKDYVKSGTVLKNYAHILELLLRLRQACDHPHLVVNGRKTNMIDQECVLCLDTVEDPVLTPCGHVFCRTCIMRHLATTPVPAPIPTQPQTPTPLPLSSIPTASTLSYNSSGSISFSFPPSVGTVNVGTPQTTTQSAPTTAASRPVTVTPIPAAIVKPSPQNFLPAIVTTPTFTSTTPTVATPAVSSSTPSLTPQNTTTVPTPGTATPSTTIINPATATTPPTNPTVAPTTTNSLSPNTTSNSSSTISIPTTKITIGPSTTPIAGANGTAVSSSSTSTTPTSSATSTTPTQSATPSTSTTPTVSPVVKPATPIITTTTKPASAIPTLSSQVKINTTPVNKNTPTPFLSVTTLPSPSISSMPTTTTSQSSPSMYSSTPATATPSPTIPISPTTCPTCQMPLSAVNLSSVGTTQTTAHKEAQAGPWKSSTKINSLVSELTELAKTEPEVKSIVFSQWTSMLTLVEPALRQAGLSHVRIDGGMTPKARENSLRTFRTDPVVKVLLASTRAGGVGLTLTAASRVFLLDPWWNPAAEEQAIDRVHRIGQTRPVVVTRFVIKGSIEESILKLQDGKRVLASAALEKGAPRQMRIDELRLLFNE